MLGFVRPLLLFAPALLMASVPLAPASAQQGYGCDRSALGRMTSTSTGNLVGTLGGAALGGLLGNQVGKGSGKTVATIAGVVGGALVGGYVGRSMDSTDQACVGQTLEQTRTNQTVAWHNPDNDSSYWVTPTRTYKNQYGQSCRDYTTDAVASGQRQQVVSTACRQSDGTWQTIASSDRTPPPQPAYYGQPSYAPPPSYSGQGYGAPPSYSAPPSYGAPPAYPPPSYGASPYGQPSYGPPSGYGPPPADYR